MPTMTPEVVAGFIGGLVALLTSSVTGVLTWLQLRRERKKWAIDLRVAIELEHVKIRLQHFPTASEIIGRLSSRGDPPVSPETVRDVGRQLNAWFYSAGGLCSDKSTRGAILGLRDSCLQWQDGQLPPDVLTWRDLALFCLRRDLHLVGLDEFNPDDTASSLRKLRDEMDAVAT